MSEEITKEDLRQFGLQLVDNLRKVIQMAAPENGQAEPEWLKSRLVRKMLDISPGSLQNLRITGKIRFRKVLGSYYYNKSDLQELFNKANGQNGNG